MIARIEIVLCFMHVLGLQPWLALANLFKYPYSPKIKVK